MVGLFANRIVERISGDDCTALKRAATDVPKRFTQRHEMPKIMQRIFDERLIAVPTITIPKSRWVKNKCKNTNFD